MYKDQVELGKCWEGASVWFSEPSRPERPSSRHPRKWLYGQCLDMNIMYLTLYALTMMIVYQYTIRVSAENALGEGLPSGKQTVKTLQEAPEGA